MNEHERLPLDEPRDAEERTSSPQLDVLQAALLDAPVHVRAIACLAGEERDRFWKALDLLNAGGGAVVLACDGDMGLTGLGVFEALLVRSWTVRYHDPKEMVHLARAALRLSESLDPQTYGEQQVIDCQARAWGELANAFRVADRHLEAAWGFSKAIALIERGAGDPYLRTRVFDLEASLLGASRKFDLAMIRLEKLPDIYRYLGESHLAGRALVIWALYTFYQGDTQEAIRLNTEGLGLIDRERDAGLFMLAIHNQLLYLVELGYFEKAKRLLFDSRSHFLYRNRVAALSLRWIEGRVNYGLRKLTSAELAYREVRDGFAEMELAFHSAVASLDLAMVLMRQGKTGEAEAEVRAAQKIFLALDACYEFLGSVAFLEETFRMNIATVDLLEITAAHIRRKEMQLPYKPR